MRYVWRFAACASLVCGISLGQARAQKNFGFDNTKPSGQPYLTPEESVKRMHVPPGWEVKVFAAEPDVINPIAFSVDERGRVWVLECFEYPKRTPKGQKPRDRIKILEDPEGTGRATKVTLWAEGKDLPTGWDLATGLEVGHGGVFLGAAPHLFFLQDTTGRGKCDKQEVLLSGFGSSDTHETLNTFQWGPDGRLYGLHGIFTPSKVNGVQVDAAVWRYDVREKRFDIFADGTSNPWGLDFDQHGQAFLACCVIPHCFHMIPGGTYIRQDGRPYGSKPYAYGQLKEICDHVHHQESGWAHAGMLVMQGKHVPEDLQGSLLMGSIHGCMIKRDLLVRRGSTYVARHAPDFLVSDDKNFRPINLRWAPDGSIYVIDWHDQNPCHQAAPDSWDYTHGRIYKIQRKGTNPRPVPDLSKKTSAELVELLSNDNPWWHRTALRLLDERRDRSVDRPLLQLVGRSKDDTLALRALWGLDAVGAFNEATAETILHHESRWLRAWAIRLLGESGIVSDKMLARLTEMADKDEAPEVRLQLASTARRLAKQDTLPLLHNLMKHKADASDPCLPLMIWLAYEPKIAAAQAKGLDWLRDHAAGNNLVANDIVPRAMRRLVAIGSDHGRAACIAFLGQVTDSLVRQRALEGLLTGLQNQYVDPPADWPNVLAMLLRDDVPEVRRLADRLAIKFRDAGALKRSLAVARDTTRPSRERVEAVRDIGVVHAPETLQPLFDLLASDKDDEVRGEACRSLSAYNDQGIATKVLGGWKSYPPSVRVEAVNLLAGRKEWARDLLAAVGSQKVPRTDLTDNTILRIRAFKDRRLDEQIKAVWGQFRDTPAELDALIDKVRTHLYEGAGSFERGRKVFENQCGKCHRFEGKGHDVGPNLDGAARDIEYLLVNVIDPNRVVGAPYFTRFATLKNGRVESGLLAAEDGASITLKTENDALKVIQKKDIEELTVQERSLMPEGLANNMKMEEFRDLIRYLMAHPFLTDVSVSGPYDPNRLPIKDDLVWSPLSVGPPGRIALPPVRGMDENMSLVAAEVTAPSPLRTRLLLGSAAELRVLLNDKPVYTGTPGKLPYPDEAGVEVELLAGKNRLLFMARYKGENRALYARLLDPQRKLTYPENGTKRQGPARE
jgi:putative membrane-bound dehydrogenase-like protein